MSSRKRPLTALPNPPTASQTHVQANNTPGHRTPYQPSTPHAIRALQQQAQQHQNTKTRSLRRSTIRRFAPDEVDPSSARGVLRRFAKITAPATRQQQQKPKTPNAATGKENVGPDHGLDDEEEKDQREFKKPRMTFDFDESIEESFDEDPPEYHGAGDEEDSELLGAAPTPSVLPDEDDVGGDATITFESIAQARMRSRASMPANGEDGEADVDATMLTERGRRAFTEDATGRLSRYSFGSIRMSDFGSELEIARDSNGVARKGRLSQNTELLRKSLPAAVLDETQDIRQSMDISGEQPTAARLREDELMLADGDDSDFQLAMPEDHIFTAREAAHAQQDLSVEADDGWEDEENAADADPVHLSPSSKRRLTLLQLASSRQETTTRRRRKVKMTRHGTLAPALPTGLIKKIATEVQVRNGRRKPAFGPDHTKALEQATEWFFEQVGEDLATYSTHGRRKRRLDVDDVLLLMRRQRVVSKPGALEKLAKEWLPEEVLRTVELPEEE
ncbi:uncharacterized protein AB675_12156 [Cyphellophora attinorum]|uniref:CENP-T/Histone H4 histone fold domain-containing protein n=1 Tax=Cyphellophora attinorum TaxID=1664694 RepID=A0A0N1H745_9EURO|nr:uncharacterized protein AB675_12156 [Phialophora attinorum]KPI38363.1 hypothetical protein AB675_12156 [Phialophora attinorum]